MTIATSLAALAFVGLSSFTARPVPPSAPQPGAARACVAPERTGTFRLFASKADGTNPFPAVLLLENVEGCLEASFVTDARGPAFIDHLSVSGDTLTGSLNVTGSEARVTFRFSNTGVAGTIMEHKQEWRVEGKRTS